MAKVKCNAEKCMFNDNGECCCTEIVLESDKEVAICKIVKFEEEQE